ncbi:MAG: hypothetical protein K0R98_10 [Rickettsiaceae bacterium]|jgi:hypothetical protein|nr:hypothetical protein [Rickettsiaceae bacterium]
MKDGIVSLIRNSHVQRLVRTYNNKPSPTRLFIPPIKRNLTEEFELSTQTMNEEHIAKSGEGFISNQEVKRARKRDTGEIVFAKRYDHLMSRELLGQQQPKDDETVYMCFKEAAAGILMNMSLCKPIHGQTQIPKVEVAKSTENAKDIFWHLSYEIKNHRGTLKDLNDNAAISSLDEDGSIFYLEAKDGKTYARMVDASGLYGEKNKEYMVRVVRRFDLKAALELIRHKDAENHHNNIVMITWYDPEQKEYIGMPAMYDFGNAFLRAGFKTEHGFKTIREAAIFLALNPLDDVVKELHLNDREIVKRWPVKKEALENLLEVPIEEVQKVFDWFEQNVPDSQKQFVKQDREALFETREVIAEAVKIIQKLFDVAEATISGGKEVKFLKTALTKDNDEIGGAVAILDRFIEVLAGASNGKTIKGEVGEKYMEMLDSMAKTLNISEKPYIAASNRKNLELS